MKKVWKGMFASGAYFAACGALCHAQPPVPASPVVEEEAVVHQDPVPPEVPASAAAAVSRLGEEVVLGRYQVAIERMNPLWMERMAAQSLVTKEELMKQIEGVSAEMVRQGISIISFKLHASPRVYQVSPGHRVGNQAFGYTKWLVLVPTATRFRSLSRVQSGPPQLVIIESISFQVAISDKGTTDWTFIDGAGLKVSDLRGLFPTLPRDMQLPPTEKKVIR